jgi:hypothetical protein
MLSLPLSNDAPRRSITIITRSTWIGCFTKCCQLCRVDFKDGDDMCEYTASASKIKDIILGGTKFTSKGKNPCCPHCSGLQKKREPIHFIHRECLECIDANFGITVTQMGRALNEVHCHFPAGQKDSGEGIIERWRQLRPEPDSTIKRIVDLPAEICLNILERCPGSFMCNHGFLDAMISHAQTETGKPNVSRINLWKKFKKT